MCFHHDCTKAIHVFLFVGAGWCRCRCQLAYFLANRVQFLAKAVHTAGVTCTKQYMQRSQQTRNSFWDCFGGRWLIRVSMQFFQFSPYWHQLWDQWSSYSPLLFCLGLGPPVKSESGFTSRVQTEEACDGSPFFSFPSLWHPLPSWHKFAPNWHTICQPDCTAFAHRGRLIH